MRFRDLSGNSAFTGAANGNDIKILNTSDLDITVFNSADIAQVTTTRDIFSLKGSGQAFIKVTALEADGTFKDFNFGGFTLGTEYGNAFSSNASESNLLTDVNLPLADNLRPAARSTALPVR